MTPRVSRMAARKGPEARWRRRLGHQQSWTRLGVVPRSDGASLTREEEDALWRQVFTPQPARRRVFEPSSSLAEGRLPFTQGRGLTTYRVRLRRPLAGAGHWRRRSAARSRGRACRCRAPCRPATRPGAARRSQPNGRSARGGSRLRDRTAEAQGHRASGLALVTAAIALWNTVYLGRAVEALRRREAVPNALLAHLAPLGWQHVNLTGDYLWDTGAALAPDGFRPLRGSRPTSAAA